MRGRVWNEVADWLRAANFFLSVVVAPALTIAAVWLAAIPFGGFTQLNPVAQIVLMVGGYAFWFLLFFGVLRGGFGFGTPFFWREGRKTDPATAAADEADVRRAEAEWEAGRALAARDERDERKSRAQAELRRVQADRDVSTDTD